MATELHETELKLMSQWIVCCFFFLFPQRERNMMHWWLVFIYLALSLCLGTQKLLLLKSSKPSCVFTFIVHNVQTHTGG